MPAAIKPVEPAENDYLAELEKKAGRPNAFYRMMAHKPQVLEHFVPVYRAITGPGAVERRLKELVYLAASYANECPYCTATHIAGGKRAGLTEEEMRAVQVEQDHNLADAERAAVQYARELTRTAAADDTLDALYEHFSNEQIIEITLVVAMANFTNRFNNALGLQPEE